jgi:hypothetical protein
MNAKKAKKERKTKEKSIFGAAQQQKRKKIPPPFFIAAAQQHFSEKTKTRKSGLWVCKIQADYKSLYSNSLDCKSSGTGFCLKSNFL